MPARWLFVLVLLAYLFGPSRAGEAEGRFREDPALAGTLRLPAAGVLRIVYPHVAAEDRARWTGRLLCAFCAAGAVAVAFLTLRRLASAEAALLLAASAAFASPLWSWASRSDVPAAAASLVLATLLWLSVGRSERSPRFADASDLGAGALAASLVFLGTTSLAAPLLLLAFVRSAPLSVRSSMLSLSGGAATALCLSWLEREVTARPLPWTEDRFARFDPAVPAAYLVSPGRGLVFFAPIVLLAVAALLRGERGRRSRIVWGGVLVLLAVLAELAARPDPWGPWGFGPTLLSAYVPLLAVMAARLPKTLLRAGAVLSVPAAVAHGAAVFLGGHTWDERRMVVHNPEALWDVSDSPFSDLAFGPPRPDPAGFAAVGYFMRPGDSITRAGLPLPWLVYGWEQPEPKGVWASGRESWIVIGAPPGDYVLTLIATAPRHRGQEQHLEVERPTGPPLELTFSRGLWELEPLSIPFRAERNISVLKLRPGHTWMPGHGDVRRCSVFLAALRLQRRSPEVVSVVLATERGPIELGVDLHAAPATAKNFLRYVDNGHYDGGTIHRTVKLDNQPDKNVRIEVIQGGVNPARKKDGFGPIALERTSDTGLSHLDGTLSMARDGPDTASSDFFICIGNQPSLDFGGQRNPDGQGFAAFGRVVSGMDVVRAIQNAPAVGQRLTPPVRIISARRR